MNNSFMRCTLSTLTLLAALATVSFGSVINEIESNGTALNNTLATAQVISPSSFTTPNPATVFSGSGFLTATIQGQNGGSDVDFYRFSSPGGRVFFDIDNTPATFDPLVAVFNSTGTLIAYGDDSALDPGSANTVDSFVGALTLPSAGNYYVAVSESPNFPTTALTGTETALTRPDGLAGGFAVSGVAAGVSTYDFNGVQAGNAAYTLHITATPEPSAYLLTAFGCALVTLGVRRRNRATHNS